MPERITNPELQQKWRDFVNPTKIEHYGYHFTESEMRQFPEGRTILCGLKQHKRRMRPHQIIAIAAALGRQMNETMDKLVLGAINAS